MNATPLTTPRRQAIAYVRVSTEIQARDGVSLDAQRARIQLYCDMHDIEIVEWCSDEGISGKTIERRPGVRRAIARACELKATLIAYSLSRVSRSLRDMLDIAAQVREHGADLASLTEQFDTATPMGRFLFTLFGALAQLERETIGERVTMALNHVRKEGGRSSYKAPYGWKLDKKAKGGMSVQPEEQEVVVDILGKFADLPDRAVASALNFRGAKIRGRKWYFRDVARIRAYQAKLK